MICGVDEAGKGSVLGPMVIAAVKCTSMEEIAIPGIADSKTLTPGKRANLYDLITGSYPHVTVIRTAEEIDQLRMEMTMNEIVARAHAEAVLTIHAETAYLDACDVNAERYEAHLLNLTGNSTRIIARHKADALFPVVSAASIVAKVTRDRAIEELHETWGDFGSGYPSDPRTISFLTGWITRHESPPSVARASWETVKQIISRLNQRSLADF